MTSRIYYTDAGAREFEAVVRSSSSTDGGAEIVLDRTAFYPTSGGQPFDVGRLNDADVIDVTDGDDGEVVHRVTKTIAPGDVVRGVIDWGRRFDHMQQHTGQHMLSAAFDARFGVRTESFHMGSEVSTIDLAREVTAAEIAEAEAEANRVVWEDRPVRVRFVSEAEARALPLRKEPARGGTLRLVEIEDFDLSACGGTHVARTGAVGLIAIAVWDRFKGASRVTFVCGGRALASYGALRDRVAAAARVLRVSPADLLVHVERVQREARDAARALKQASGDLARYRGVELRASAETIGGLSVVLRSDPAWDAATLKPLAQSIVAAPGLVAGLVGGGQPAPVVVARSADVDLDAGSVVSEAAKAFGGRGGGRPDLAQGGLGAPGEAIVTFLRKTLAAHGARRNDADPEP